LADPRATLQYWFVGVRFGGALKIGGVEVAKQRELEEKYLTWDSLEKYERSPGRNPS